MAEVIELAVLTLLCAWGLMKWSLGVKNLGYQFSQTILEVRKIDGSIFYRFVVYAQQRVVVLVTGMLHIEQSHACFPLVLEY